MKELSGPGEGFLKGFQPEVDLGEIDNLTELIQAYHKLELGRPITLVTKIPATNKSSAELGGYILSTPNQLQHIVIIRSGEVYLVGPKSDKPDDITKYQANHRPSKLPFPWPVDPDLEVDTEGLDTCIDNGIANLYSKVLLSNKNGPSEELDNEITQAVDWSHHLRDLRIEGKDTSRKALLKRGYGGPNYTPVFSESPTTSSNLGSSEVFTDNTIEDEYCPSD